MKVNNPLEYSKYFNAVLEHCKTKYDMPEDKIQRLHEYLKPKFKNSLKLLNEFNVFGVDSFSKLVSLEEFYFNFKENPPQPHQTFER